MVIYSAARAILNLKVVLNVTKTTCNAVVVLAKIQIQENHIKEGMVTFFECTQDKIDITKYDCLLTQPSITIRNNRKQLVCQKVIIFFSFN